MGNHNEHSNHLILSSHQPNSFSPSFLNYLLSTYYEPDTALDPRDTRLPGVPLAMPEAESRILSSFLCGLINIAPCSQGTVLHLSLWPSHAAISPTCAAEVLFLRPIHCSGQWLWLLLSVVSITRVGGWGCCLP